MLIELAARGFPTVDTDYDDWTLPDGLWDGERMDDLLAHTATVVVSGTVENQGRFYDRFEHIVLLSAPVDLLIERVATRRNNAYGSQPAEQADIRRYAAEVEPLLRKGSTVELDGRTGISELADTVETLIRRSEVG